MQAEDIQEAAEVNQWIRDVFERIKSTHPEFNIPLWSRFIDYRVSGEVMTIVLLRPNSIETSLLVMPTETFIEIGEEASGDREVSS